MIKFYRLVVYFLALFSNNVYSNQGLNSEISQENAKIYMVTEVAFFDDGGYNDELFVVLGDKELFLTIRWYTGVIFTEGDEIIVFRNADSSDITIDGNSYALESNNFYILR